MQSGRRDFALQFLGWICAGAATVHAMVPTPAVDYSRDSGHAGLVVFLKGRMVYQECVEGFSADTPVPVFSVTKSIVALGFLSAEQQRIGDLEQSVGELFSRPSAKAVRVSDLLSFSSGLPAGRKEFYGVGARNDGITAVAFFRRARLEPGMFFYGPGSYEVAGAVLGRVLSDSGQTPLEFLEKNILQPFGADVRGWRKRCDGTPFFSTGARLSLSQMAGLGELVRRDGAVGFRRAWRKGGLKNILQMPTLVPMYAIGFWRNVLASEEGAIEVPILEWLGTRKHASAWKKACVSLSAPPDLLAMIGSGGQRIFIVPSRSLVIARIGGNNDSFEDAKFLRLWFEGRKN